MLKAQHRRDRRRRTASTALRFKDGSQIPADLVVMTAGVRPNIELARQRRPALRPRDRRR